MIEVNEYFDGNVKSLSLKTDTLPATVGVMNPGQYVFNTADKEKVTVISGCLKIKLSENADEVAYTAGESFEVDAKSAFDVNVELQTAYLCLYG